MSTIVNSALGLNIGDQVRIGGTGAVHTIERIWLYDPGEYEPYNVMAPGEKTGIAAEEPVLVLQCQQRYMKERPVESYLPGIVRRGGGWWLIIYSWPAFNAPDGLLLRERAKLRMETAPPILVARDEVHLVERRVAPLQLDMFATTAAGHSP